MSFSKLGLKPSIYVPLARLGYQEPTPIQAQAIPAVLRGTDLLARAQTGTGKTAAFGLPMIERLVAARDGARPRHPRGLVLVPTRELAAQVHRALSTYGAPAQLRITAIFGGVGMGAQVQSLKHGVDIVVATPGRLIDHLQRRTIDLSAIEILTLDEADRMLDMGFLPALRRVTASLRRPRQTLLFSATLSDAVARLAAEFTRDPARVDVSDGQAVAATVTHHVHTTAIDQKRAVLTHLLTEEAASQTLVFCKTKRGSDRVGDHLERAGIMAAVIHGNKSQGARTRALGDFKAGRVTVLVATDLGGARPRHRTTAPGHQLRLATCGRGLHPPCRAHGPRGTPRACRVTRVAIRVAPAAGYSTVVAGAARAGRRQGIRGDERATIDPQTGSKPRSVAAPTIPRLHWWSWQAES
jgi:ATP-dependent RNA helicase RhlE